MEDQFRLSYLPEYVEEIKIDRVTGIVKVTYKPIIKEATHHGLAGSLVRASEEVNNSPKWLRNIYKQNDKIEKFRSKQLKGREDNE